MYDLSTPVFANSEEKNDFLKAAMEWTMVGHDVVPDETCVCGKKHLSLVFRLRNHLNCNTLYPVGSKCIHKFGRVDLIQAAAECVTERKARETVAKKEAERVRKWGAKTLSQGPWMDKSFSTICESRDGRSYVAYVRAHGMRKELKDLVNYANFISA
jgi:hypothetical protein